MRPLIGFLASFLQRFLKAFSSCSRSYTRSFDESSNLIIGSEIFFPRVWSFFTHPKTFLNALIFHLGRQPPYSSPTLNQVALVMFRKTMENLLMLRY